MTPRYLAALIAIADIPVTGMQKCGGPGRPANLYDVSKIQRAHAVEARRTAKQFTDTDWIASALLGRNLIRADTEAGHIWRPDGTRAETMLATLYGAVRAGPCQVPAHRVIWIAADGEIPAGLQVNHRNRLRWDNRRANLELVTFSHNIRHAAGSEYLNYHQAVDQLTALEPAEPEQTRPLEDLVRAGGTFRPTKRIR